MFVLIAFCYLTISNDRQDLTRSVRWWLSNSFLFVIGPCCEFGEYFLPGRISDRLFLYTPWFIVFQTTTTFNSLHNIITFWERFSKHRVENNTHSNLRICVQFGIRKQTECAINFPIAIWSHDFFNQSQPWIQNGN